MIDDLHGWYHGRATETPAKTEIAAIHVFDSIVVIEKKRRGAPAYIRIPDASAPRRPALVNSR
jgi:hypothetical protein